MKEIMTLELFPIIDMGKHKLDIDGLKRALLDSNGRGTAASKNFNFYTFNSRFDEKDDSQKYSLCFEIWFQTNYNCRFVVGQSGLFLKADKNIVFSAVNNILSEYSAFIEFVKAYMFIPIGVAHYSDGDCYIKDKFDIPVFKRADVKFEVFEEETK